MLNDFKIFRESVEKFFEIASQSVLEAEARRISLQSGTLIHTQDDNKDNLTSIELSEYVSEVNYALQSIDESQKSKTGFFNTSFNYVKIICDNTNKVYEKLIKRYFDIIMVEIFDKTTEKAQNGYRLFEVKDASISEV